MNETPITVVGNVVTDVVAATTKTGTETASFRMATTTRRFDRGIRQWVDGDTSYVRVNVWRNLARHVAASITKGDPVVVTGTLQVREWENADGRRGTSVEIEARVVGHDLNRGMTRFERPPRLEIAGTATPPGNEPAEPAAA